MRKILAVLIVLVFMLSLCACADTEPEKNPGTTQPQNQSDPENTPEPKVEPPIEVSEFGPEENMPKPFADGAENADFTAESAGITAGGRVFTLEWIYYHNTHDWVQAGITYDDGVNLAGTYIDLGLANDAWEAVKAKISDFTMLVMMDPVVIDSAAMPSVTVGDEVYDFAWLSSHNATEYTEAGIPAATVKDYMDAVRDNYGHTPEFRWIEIVYDRLVNGF